MSFREVSVRKMISESFPILNVLYSISDTQFLGCTLNILLWHWVSDLYHAFPCHIRVKYHVLNTVPVTLFTLAYFPYQNKPRFPPSVDSVSNLVESVYQKQISKIVDLIFLHRWMNDEVSYTPSFFVSFFLFKIKDIDFYYLKHECT